MTGSPLAVVFFLFLFLFLVHFQQPVHIRFGRQKLPHFFTGTPVLGVGFLLFLQQFGILSLQVLNLGQLLHTHLVKGIFGCLMEQDFLLMFLAEFLGVTSFPVGYIINHSLSKDLSPVHQAVALDALVVHIVTSDFAGVAAVSLYGIDPAAVRADDDAHMVGAAVQVPIEKDSISGGEVVIAPCAPLSMGLEPRDALGLTGGKARFRQPHLAVAPGHEAGAPFHTGIEAVPAPVGLTAHIAHLTFGNIHHSLIAGACAVYKLHTFQTLRIAGVCGAAAEDQRLVAQGGPVHLIHFQLVRGQKLRGNGGNGFAGKRYIQNVVVIGNLNGIVDRFPRGEIYDLLTTRPEDMKNETKNE